MQYAEGPRTLLYARFSMIMVLASLFYTGCASRTAADRLIQEDDIRESVFRYRIDYPKRNCPVFLSIDAKDPSDAFMRRFAASGRTVKKASESYFKEDPAPGWLRDRSTDEEGVAFSVGPISWQSSDQVEVRGGMYCGGLCADAGIYKLKKKERHWVVVEYKELMVS
jgi:hypothetical protein